MKTSLPFSPGDTVVAYVRDSGHEKQELSVDQQRQSIKDFCLQNGLILNRFFTDEARKGSSDIGRNALDEMMNYLRRNAPVHGVLVWSNSRFARNTTHAQFYRAEIRKLGYIYYSLTDHITDGPEAVIFEALIDYKNQQYLTDLSIDVKRGLRQLVEKYGCVPGSAPTGFVREQVIVGTHRDGKQRTGHRWVINDEMRDRIRQAFELRAAGASLGQINEITRLFTSVNSYRTFFCNRIYLGELQYGEDLIIPDYCEPIVDKAVFDAVQVVQNNFTRYKNLSSDSANHPRRVTSNYLLSGLAHCARCGSPLFGRTHAHKNGNKSISYFCTQAYNQRNCTKHRIPANELEKIILSTLESKLKEPAYLEALAEQKRQKDAVLIGEQEKVRKVAAKELGEVRRQITNLSNAIAETGHSKAMLARLNDLELQETQLQNNLAALDAQLPQSPPPVDPAQLTRLLSMLTIIMPLADMQTQRHILRGLIQRIDVDRDERRLFGVITIYLPDQESELKKSVRMTHDPSGPPRYTYTFEFETTISGRSGRYKNPS